MPERTLRLLDRNVSGLFAQRDAIKALRFSAKKGLHFHGPSGTGNTHTIHYLASQFPEHATLLITAEQVIARERTHMQGCGSEGLLNKLLNEMDGLRENADVLFVATTNRADELEPALAARPAQAASTRRSSSRSPMTKAAAS